MLSLIHIFSIFATQDKALQAICDEEINNDDYYPASEVGLSYAFTIVRADGTIENFGQEHIAAYMKEVYGDKYGLVFDSEETARAYVEEWKATVVRPDDQSHDEAFSTSPQPQASFLIMDQYTGCLLYTSCHRRYHLLCQRTKCNSVPENL